MRRAIGRGIAMVALATVACRSHDPSAVVADGAAKPRTRSAPAPEGGAFRGAFSSPSIVRDGATLHGYFAYYTARLEAAGTKKCIWRAHASTPDGPFVDDYAGPIECEPSTLWAIDPYLVEGPGGQW